MKIQVILASTRPGRVSERMAKWVIASAGEMPGFEVELVDMADHSLPLYDEAISPKYNPNRTPTPAVAAFIAKLGEAEGYIIVTPEYNRTMPGVLKNALDYLDWQLDRKPVAIASHGGSGGALAAENIRTAIRQLGAVNVPDAVTITGASELLDETGALDEALKASPYGPQTALSHMLASLAWYANTLAAGRKAAPRA